MRHVWSIVLLAGVLATFAATAQAQRFPQVMNANTHEGKYDVGGIGMQFGGGFGFGGGLHREGPSSMVIDGNLEAVFRRRFTQTQRRIVAGGKLDFQIGSDNSFVGTNFFLEFYSHSMITAGATELGTSSLVVAPNTNPVYTAQNKSATVMYLGFAFILNFYKSEFIETDGRRTRNNWGLSMLVGPKISMLSGDFGDINGMASIGLDIGLMADVPLPLSGAEDLLSISPYFIFEINSRMGVDTGLQDENPASDTFGADVLNDSFDLGFYSQTQEDADGDGLPDYDGIAVRRHNFIPAYQLSLGAKINLTPIFLSRSGQMINNWRFWGSLTASIPMSLGLASNAYIGDALWQSNELPLFTLTLSVGASYFF